MFYNIVFFLKVKSQARDPSQKKIGCSALYPTGHLFTITYYLVPEVNRQSHLESARIQRVVRAGEIIWGAEEAWFTWVIIT